MENSPPDQTDWLGLYSNLLESMFERNLGDFLLHAFISDLQEAWIKAMHLWQQAPGRYGLIQDQWQDSLLKFNESIAAGSQNLLDSLASLKALHADLEQCLVSIVNETPDLGVQEVKLLNFGVRHLVNALAPEYWPATNPDVVREAMDSGGTSIVRGLQNFQEDLKHSRFGLDVKTAAKEDFVLGDTLAATPGEVVFENELFQLLQYYPFSQKVIREPLIIVPPWINKYYVLDLNPSDSFVHWAVRQGHTVFMLSWVNPGPRQNGLSLSDYLVNGCVEAITRVKELTGTRQVNLAGYCIGGMLAACAVAYLNHDKNHSVKSLSLFNTMLDHSEPGDISVFLSERMLAALDKCVSSDGIFDGRIMRQAFTMLREDRMFWPQVVNNYLLGKTPAPNPVLYWNQDATNLPGTMIIEFLRDMYRDNLLTGDKAYQLGGRDINLHHIDIPVYALGCRNDHIIPWQSAYKSTQAFTCMVNFVLVNSGHVMGVVNPPNKNRSGFWINEKLRKKHTPESWLQEAVFKEGSWWPHWQDWISDAGIKKVKARFPGGAGNEIIESAPGRYVKQSCEKKQAEAD